MNCRKCDIAAWVVVQVSKFVFSILRNSIAGISLLRTHVLSLAYTVQCTSLAHEYPHPHVKYRRINYNLNVAVAGTVYSLKWWCAEFSIKPTKYYLVTFDRRGRLKERTRCSIRHGTHVSPPIRLCYVFMLSKASVCKCLR